MNKNLINAKSNKKDEFYTQLTDIELELKHYKNHFNGKIVYCNTDNYKHSNFVKYFLDNFKDLKLKKIISLDLNGNYFEYDGVIKQYSKFENGDFRGEYSIGILKGVDIVVTNPPFSLFREYIGQLMQHQKHFLIIGNSNGVAYKEVFPLIKNNKVWLGYNTNTTMTFQIPNNYNKYFEIKDGKKYTKVPAISWFTNLDIDKRSESIKLTKTYKGNEEQYPKYDNYDAIEVSRVANIPKDYKGVMGVPVTYLAKHNPKQFEILGITHKELLGTPCTKTYKNMKQGKVGKNFILNKKQTDFSPKIVYKKRPNKTCYIADNVDGFMIVKYHRVFIKKH